MEGNDIWIRRVEVLVFTTDVDPFLYPCDRSRLATDAVWIVRRTHMKVLPWRAKRNRTLYGENQHIWQALMLSSDSSYSTDMASLMPIVFINTSLFLSHNWKWCLWTARDYHILLRCKQNMNSLMISLAHKFTKLQVLTLRQNNPQLEDSVVEVVANYCHDLRELDLSRSFRLSDRSLYALAHGCPRLTRLDISRCSSFSDTTLTYLTCRCKNLKCLNLCGCVKAASDRALQAIAQNCGQLQPLNLGWCDEVTDKGVTSLASGCPDLRVVDLCGCVLITVRIVVRIPINQHYEWCAHQIEECQSAIIQF